MAGDVSQNDKLRVAACKGDVETIKELYAAGAKFDVDKVLVQCYHEMRQTVVLPGTKFREGTVDVDSRRWRCRGLIHWK